MCAYLYKGLLLFFGIFLFGNWQLASLWVSCFAGALDVKEYETILRKVGFKDVEVQPALIYQGKVLEDIAGESLEDLSESELSELDGAFASAYVKGRK